MRGYEQVRVDWIEVKMYKKIVDVRGRTIYVNRAAAPGNKVIRVVQ